MTEKKKPKTPRKEASKLDQIPRPILWTLIGFSGATLLTGVGCLGGGGADQYWPLILVGAILVVVGGLPLSAGVVIDFQKGTVSVSTLIAALLGKTSIQTKDGNEVKVDSEDAKVYTITEVSRGEEGKRLAMAGEENRKETLAKRAGSGPVIRVDSAEDVANLIRQLDPNAIVN